LHGVRLAGVLFYGVVSGDSRRPSSSFVDREAAERVVTLCNRDEPDRAGELNVERIEFETSRN
jgi:hypothetical protein